MPCPPPGHFPNPGIEPGSPALQVDSLPAELPEKPWNSVYFHSSHREPGGQGSPSLTEILPAREANPSCRGLTWDAGVSLPLEAFGMKGFQAGIVAHCFCFLLRVSAKVSPFAHSQAPEKIPAESSPPHPLCHSLLFDDPQTPVQTFPVKRALFNNGDADIENRLLDTVGKGEGERNPVVLKQTLPYGKQTPRESLLYDTGSSAQCSVTT